MRRGRAAGLPGLALGLDVGTQGTKALLVDMERRVVVARAGRAYGLIEHLPPGCAEQQPETWWRAAIECLHELATKAPPRAIRAVGVSGQQHGLVGLDAERRVLRPAKLWCDTSTAPEARELSRSLGRAVPTGFTASKVLWLKRHEPEHFARLAHVLLPHDYLNLRLTGELCTESGDASGTGYFDPLSRRFDPAACAAVDERMEAMLPALRAPDEPAGRLTNAAARELGLEPGILVAPGGGDNMCAAIGAGATRPGIVVLSLGTSATVFSCSEQPLIDPQGLIAPFCDSTGRWLPLLCVMNATGVLNEVQAAFRATALDLEALTRAAERIPPGSDGLLLLPYLRGERVPDLPDATAVLLGLRPALLEPAHLFRAALEGTSLNLGLGVERLRSLGLAFDDLRVVGGGARNTLWTSILADVLGLRTRALAESESAALGAAIQAAWILRRQAGEALAIDDLAQGFVAFPTDPIEPDPQRSAFYRGELERFRESVRRNFPSCALWSGGQPRLATR